MGQIQKYHYGEFTAILAIDFDLTICKSKYPDTGKEIKDAGKYIRKLVDEGYGVVINTCRNEVALAAAIVWLHEHNVPYHFINCNFPEIIQLYHGDCRKISADMYVDDKCLMGLPKWKKIYKIITKKFG
jgi:hypothetical protein